MTLMPAGHAASLRAFADRNTALSDPAPPLPQLGQISRGSRRYPATQQIRRPYPAPKDGPNGPVTVTADGDTVTVYDRAQGSSCSVRISADARSWSTPPAANWLAGT